MSSSGIYIWLPLIPYLFFKKYTWLVVYKSIIKL